MKRGWPPASKGLLHPAGGRRLGRAVSRGGCTRPCLVEHSPDRPLWLRCLGDMAKPKTRRAARCSLAGRRACRRRARLGHAHERRGLQGCGTSRSRGGAGGTAGAGLSAHPGEVEGALPAAAVRVAGQRRVAQRAVLRGAPPPVKLRPLGRGLRGARRHPETGGRHRLESRRGRSGPERGAKGLARGGPRPTQSRPAPPRAPPSRSTPSPRLRRPPHRAWQRARCA